MTKITITDNSEEKSNTFSIGMWFRLEGEILFLAQPESGCVVALSPQDMNRWREPVEVNDVKRITQDEMCEILARSNAEVREIQIFSDVKIEVME